MSQKRGTQGYIKDCKWGWEADKRGLAQGVSHANPLEASSLVSDWLIETFTALHLGFVHTLQDVALKPAGKEMQNQREPSIVLQLGYSKATHLIILRSVCDMTHTRRYGVNVLQRYMMHRETTRTCEPRNTATTNCKPYLDSLFSHQTALWSAPFWRTDGVRPGLGCILQFWCGWWLSVLSWIRVLTSL